MTRRNVASWCVQVEAKETTGVVGFRTVVSYLTAFVFDPGGEYVCVRTEVRELDDVDTGKEGNCAMSNCVKTTDFNGGV